MWLFSLSFRPHCSIIAARDFNRRQSIFMSFRFILSKTTRLTPFPYGDMEDQKMHSALPAMIAQADLDNYPGQSTHMHLVALQP